jgi:class 3 adenylate cyclase/tetratricopeptide (TPR) repeat protein
MTDRTRARRPERSPERRQLTVMYCDLVASTALFAELDPEEVSEILRTYCQCCADHIEAAGGFVAQFQGDGVIGYFGYAKASESDAERAVRAALHLVKAVPNLKTVQGKGLGVRVGISTGLVVVGDMKREGTRLEQSAVGAALHLAARLQSLGTANEILVSDDTRRLTGRLFVYRSKGKFPVKGFDEAISVWKVVGPHRLTGHLRRKPLLVEMVDRKVELKRLMLTWERAVAGHGQVVSIVGSAGIGKSRLLHEFRRRIGRGGQIWIEGAGAQFFANTPFHVVSQLIRRVLDPRGRASTTELRMRLEHSLAEAGIEGGDILPLLSDMVCESALDTSTSVTADERRKLFALLVEWLTAGAERRPLIIVVEDLHWSDPSSLELASLAIGKIDRSRVLLLLTARSGYVPTLLGKEGTEVLLHPLTDDELRQVVAMATAGNRSLTERDVTRVVQRAEGVPLFGIELARLVGERDRNHEIPSSLADLLAARLDQVGLAKSLAQTAAVIGDTISMPLLKAVSHVPTKRLLSWLMTLQEHDILRTTGDSAAPDYEFTHALLRDAAYASLLKDERRKLHRRVATVLSSSLVELAARRPELVARHWTGAGDWKMASAAWQGTGDVASARRSFVEAEQAYTHALSALLALPHSAARDASELTLQSALADALRITRGFSAPETREATARAGVLVDRHGDREQQFLQMWANWTGASSGGDYAVATEVADRFQRLALVDGKAVNLAHAYMIQMTSKYRTGNVTAAEEQFTRGEPSFRIVEFESRPGVIAQTYGNAALIAWILGKDAEARRRIDHALVVADRNGNPFDLAYAGYMASNYAILTGELTWATELAESSIALSDKHNFPQFSAISRVALGRAQAGLGVFDEGMELMRSGMRRMADAAVRVSITVYWAWLTEVHCLAGNYAEAELAASEALTVNPQELFFQPEIVRLGGEVAFQLGRREKAKEAFQQAIELSRRMNSSRFAKRAMKSLEHLLRE